MEEWKAEVLIYVVGEKSTWGTGPKVRKLLSYSWLCNELAVCPWAGHFPSLSLNFLIL